MKLWVLAVCLSLTMPGCSSAPKKDPEPPKVKAPKPYPSVSRSPIIVPFAKILRGATNVLLSPLDIPATMARVTHESDNVVMGVLAGGTEGVGNGAVRLVAGVFEILTFPLVYDWEPLYDRKLGERAYYSRPEPVPPWPPEEITP